MGLGGLAGLDGCIPYPSTFLVGEGGDGRDRDCGCGCGTPNLIGLEDLTGLGPENLVGLVLPVLDDTNFVGLLGVMMEGWRGGAVGSLSLFGWCMGTMAGWRGGGWVEVELDVGVNGEEGENVDGEGANEDVGGICRSFVGLCDRVLRCNSGGSCSFPFPLSSVGAVTEELIDPVRARSRE